MQVASLELCRTLFELSGWSDTDWINQLQFNDDKPSRKRIVVLRETDACDSHDHKPYPAYDLGYLLRKLPEQNDGSFLQVRKSSGQYLAFYAFDERQGADTPEDAACRLAIELFKQGVLARGEATPQSTDSKPEGAGGGVR